MTEYLSILLAGETDSGYNSSFFFPSLSSIIQLITSNDNYGTQIDGFFEA
jgi:hypothetical protein